VKRRKSAALPEVQANLDDQKNISGIEQNKQMPLRLQLESGSFVSCGTAALQGWFIAEQQFAMTAPRDYTGLLVNGSGL
jgi:hypothetical protein